MTTSPIFGRLSILFGVLLALALLASACGSNGAVDVTPAKLDEDATGTGSPNTADQPAESEPSDTNGHSTESDPGDAEEQPATSEPSDTSDRAPEGDPSDADTQEPSSEPPETQPGPSTPTTSNGWTRLSPAADLLYVQTVPGSRAIVAGGPGEGLLSSDGGVTWTRLDWPGEVRSAAHVDPSGQVVVVAGSSSQLGLDEKAAFRSEDAGATWDPVLIDTPVLGWFVLDSFLHAVPGHGVFASNDALETRTLLSPASIAWAEKFDPVLITTNPDNLAVFAVTSIGLGGSASVRMTRDSGTSFVQLAPEFDLWGVTIPIFTGIGPLIMSQGVGVLFSFDQGQSWFVQNQGLEQLRSLSLYLGLVDFVFPPQRSLPVVASQESIFTFNPGGWQEMAGPGPEIRALAVVRADIDGGEELLLTATDEGVWSIPTAALGRNEP